MTLKPSISLIIPCLNEEAGLSSLLPKVPAQINEVVVVDGFSTDNTKIVAERHGEKVFLEKKKGYGLAIRTGFDNAKGSILITQDGDGTYPIDKIPDLLKYFFENNLDFLVGCRFPLRHRGSMTVRNFFGNLLISSVTSLLFGYQVTDVCSGMWVISKKAWLKIGPKINDNKWFFSNEIKIQAILEKGLKYDEYWIELTSRSGETKVGNVWLIGLKVLWQTIYKRITNL